MVYLDVHPPDGIGRLQKPIYGVYELDVELHYVRQSIATYPKEIAISVALRLVVTQ